ncbi:periplasmic heavy metal sensor [Epibacterium sp. SM1979]|uniref:Periplasmic heavy metal sensor n=1 Tax=Tritonibacter litoralis TaxID=2662264 RepID=A0A843YI17_9RHOB|nr:periplasmic heavy metal sensor [Tritonibacter litoralis]
MSDAQTPQKPSKGPRWVRILLVISLAVNVAVVGVMAGTAYRIKDRRGGHDGPPSLSVMVFRAMEPEMRRDLMRRAAGHHKDLRAQRHADRDALYQALRAEPFDAAAVAAVLEEQAQRQYQVREGLRMVWLEEVSQMSAEERAQLIERLENPPHHRFKEHKRWGGRD